MGCQASKDGPSKQNAQVKTSGTGSISAKDRKKLNPADYIISKKTGETIVKEDGTINGEQFNIEECKDCDIFLVDTIAASFVDYCEDCRIYIGPVVASAMIRNCKNCSIVMACRQFRTRDCSDCRFSLFCATEPIIETSVNMQFACFDFFYFSLRDQLNRAKLRPWNNKWSQVYDFNKNVDKPNWSLLPEDEVQSLLRPDKCPCIGAEESTHDHVVPITLGCRPRPSQESCFVVFLPGSDVYIEAFLARATKSAGWSLVRCRAMSVDAEQAKTLFNWSQDKKAVIDRCKGKEIAGIEVCGNGCFSQVEEVLNSTGLVAGSKSILVVPKEHTTELPKAFFETWKDAV